MKALSLHGFATAFDHNTDPLAAYGSAFERLDADSIDTFVREVLDERDIVDTTNTLSREFERIIEDEFDANRFRSMTTPTLLFTGGESLPGIVDVTETVDEEFQASRSVRINGVSHFGLISKGNHFGEEVLASLHES